MNMIEGAGILRDRLARRGRSYQPLAVTGVSTLPVYRWLAVQATDEVVSVEPREPEQAVELPEFAIV